jgi:hypothetical protein
VVCRFGPDRLQRNAAAVADDATLLMLASPDLDMNRPLTNLGARVRLALPCMNDGIRGYWFQFGPKGHQPHFVLVNPSGGTAGAEVYVIAHSVSYSNIEHFFEAEQGYQTHRFRISIDANSRIPPYAGDIDDDDKPELLIAAEVTNLSATTPRRYRVFDWVKDRLKKLNTVPAADLDTSQLQEL